MKLERKRKRRNKLLRVLRIMMMKTAITLLNLVKSGLIDMKSSISLEKVPLAR